MGELLGCAARPLLLTLLCGILVGAAAAPCLAQDAPAGKKPAKAAPRKDAKAEKKAAEGTPAPADAKADEGAPGGATADAAPGAQPAPNVPLADLWVLDFHFQRVASVQPTEGLHRGELYWYLLYRVENKTGQDREAYISIAARSNRDKSYADVYLPDVEPLIEHKVGKPLWGKVDQFQSLKERAEKGEITAEKGTFNYSRFKAGEVRDCVAIFNKLDAAATRITITIDGLSNDLHLIDREGGGRQIQSRSYVLELERPGDEYAMNLDRFQLLKKYWSKKTVDLVVPKEG